MVGNGPENRDRYNSLTEFDSLAFLQTRGRSMVGPLPEEQETMVRIHPKGPQVYEYGRFDLQAAQAR